jgi:hypothetical protein
VASVHSELSITRLIGHVRNGMSPAAALAHLKMIASVRGISLEQLHDDLETSEARCRLQGLRPTVALREIVKGLPELPWPK